MNKGESLKRKGEEIWIRTKQRGVGGEDKIRENKIAPGGLAIAQPTRYRVTPMRGDQRISNAEYVIRRKLSSKVKENWS